MAVNISVGMETSGVKKGVDDAGKGMDHLKGKVDEVTKAGEEAAESLREVGDAGKQAGAAAEQSMDAAGDATSRLKQEMAEAKARAEELQTKIRETGDDQSEGGGGGGFLAVAAALGEVALRITRILSLLGLLALAFSAARKKVEELADSGNERMGKLSEGIGEVSGALGAALDQVRGWWDGAMASMLSSLETPVSIARHALQGLIADQQEAARSEERLAEAEERRGRALELRARIEADAAQRVMAAEFAKLETVEEVDAAIRERQDAAFAANEKKLDQIEAEIDHLLRLRGAVERLEQQKEQAAKKEAERQEKAEKRAAEKAAKDEQREAEKAQKDEERHQQELQRERDKAAMTRLRIADQERAEQEKAARDKQRELEAMGQQLVKDPAVAAIASGAGVTDKQLAQAVGEQRAREAGAEFDASGQVFDNEKQRQAARDKATQQARRAGFRQTMAGNVDGDELEIARRNAVDQRIADAQGDGRISQDQADAIRSAARSMREAADAQQQIGNIAEAFSGKAKQEPGPSFAERATQRREATQGAGEDASIQQAAGQVAGNIAALQGAMASTGGAAMAAFDALSQTVAQVQADVARQDQLWQRRTQATNSARKSNKARRNTN